MLKDVVLGEISGKNAAIHAYDGIIWKIRSGYLTLVFAGWAVLLESMAGGTLTEDVKLLLVSGMFLVSLALSLGGCTIDRNYVRRKFRVINALNALMEAIKKGGGDPHSVPVELLKVAGDDAERECESSGYREALNAGILVYWVPPILFVGVVFLVLD